MVVTPFVPAVPLALFGAAWAGVPFVPLNHRLSSTQLSSLFMEVPAPALVIADGAAAEVARAADQRVIASLARP